MKVKQKNLLWSSLPSAKDKKKIMAAQGLAMEPGPRNAGFKNLIKTLPPDYFDTILPSTVTQKPLDMTPTPDTSKAIPQPPSTANIPKPTTPQISGNGFNPGNAMLLGLSAFDALLPNRVPRQQVVQPLLSYNPNPYGTGSQALMDSGGYFMGEDENNVPGAKSGIYIKPSKRGSLRKALGVGKGEKIPASKLQDKPGDSPAMRKKKNFARNARKWNHDDGGIIPFLFQGLDQVSDGIQDATQALMGGGLPVPMKHGGIIPDNMSPFNPHKYNNGGNVNGGANLNMVGASYPNSDLLEQWLLYKQGGTVGANYPNTDLIEQWIPWMTGDYEYGGQVKNVGPNYPNTDLLEQYICYEDGGTLSPSKAKEMLRDGTANGKKLTKKQKRYFGMVAAGKADLGELIPNDPNDPKKPINSDPLNKRLRLQTTSTKSGMEKQGIDLAAATDLVNLAVSSGRLPNQLSRDEDVSLRSAVDPELYTYLYEFAQRSDIGGMTPEERVQSFYSIPSNSPNIQAMKDKLKTQGYGVRDFYNTSRLQPTNAPRPAARATPTLRFKNGGIMYDDGGVLDTVWGGNVEMASYNPYDGGMAEFKGASHENGGIGMTYNNSPVEVEGGEFASKDKAGNLNIYGNMFFPGTKTKFKTVAKEIAQKEKRYDFLKTRGAELVNNASPNNRFEQLSFNSGKIMMEGGEMGQEDISKKKERIASLQRAMLDTADEFGIDAQEMSKGKVKKAKGGASVPFYQNGGTDPNDPTRADRNNNPGNIKYGPFAKKYGAKKDKDGFAIFPSREKGLSAMQNLLKSPAYSNLTVRQAINKWTGGDPYNYNLGPITSKKVADLSADQFSDVINTMTRGEGTRYGIKGRPLVPNTIRPQTPQITAPPPYGLPPVTLTPDGQPARPSTAIPPYDTLNPPPERGPLPSNVEPLHLNQVLGEIYAAATNKVEPVPTQRFEPQLFSPYQVSFQDRINRNQNAFSAAQRSLGATNPSALGAVSAQLYEANNAVAGDEFRTNQAIANDITNKNVALLNDAQLKNLAIADTQMVRQSTARSKTNQTNQMIVNSLASKYAQNELENRRLAAYENLYDYRFVPTEDGGQYTQYYGPDAVFDFSGADDGTMSKDVRTTSRYDAQGNLKGYSEQEDSELKKAERRINVETKRRKLPLLSVPRLQ